MMGVCVEGDASPGIVDPACVPDTFVEGIGLIEVLAGFNLRVTLYQTRDLGDGTKERQVAVRLVGSMSVLPTALRQMISVAMGLPFMSDAKAPDIVPH